MLTIHVSTTRIIDKDELPNTCSIVYYPEIKFPEFVKIPEGPSLLVPKNMIAWAENWCHTFATRPYEWHVVTISEYLILAVLRMIGQKRISREQVRFVYHHKNYFEQELRLDNEGEFIDRWPDGFFNDRADLLFYEEKGT